jgi:biotin carboxyl carrier protein
MRYEIDVNGRTRQVVVTRLSGVEGFVVSVDGRTWQVDAARVDAQTLSLLVKPEVLEVPGVLEVQVRGGGESHEVVIAPDSAPRRLDVRVDGEGVVVAPNGRRRWGGDAAGRDGPQSIVAPMPGKIVRVLVETGEAVHMRQPLVVMEAMKMENELRASRDGTVAEIRVREGTSVDAGALLVVVR